MDLATSRADRVGIEFRKLFRIMCSHFFQKGRKRWAVVLVQVVNILVVHNLFLLLSTVDAESRHWLLNPAGRNRRGASDLKVYGKTSIGTADSAPRSRSKTLLNSRADSYGGTRMVGREVASRGP